VPEKATISIFCGNKNYCISKKGKKYDSITFTSTASFFFVATAFLIWARRRR
jgi:hypothetical protein